MTRREAAKGVPASHFSHRVLRTSCSSSLPLYAYRLTPLLSLCFCKDSGIGIRFLSGRSENE